MIENFETVKKQLSELAGVINSFKSEAVQLKIIELIFGQSEESKENDLASQKPTDGTNLRRRSPSPKGTRGTGSTSRKKVTASTGPGGTLAQLLEGDFFKQSRTINDIIEHSKHNLARAFKANEFSGKLARLVRNDTLTRKKNEDGQYEYKKP